VRVPNRSWLTTDDRTANVAESAHLTRDLHGDAAFFISRGVMALIGLSATNPRHVGDTAVRDSRNGIRLEPGEAKSAHHGPNRLGH
jgi:hypothetical protein